MVSKGDVFLANLNPVKKNNEMGKTRPVLIFQNNELNHSDYPTTIVFPLSSDLIDDAEPLRMRITKRDELEKDSDVVLSQIRAIDNTRLIKKIAHITDEEIIKIKELFDEIVE
jgi:mRNA interferase MazF